MSSKRRFFSHPYTTHMEHVQAEQFRGVYYYLFAGIALLVAAFLFVAPTNAQTVEESTAIEGEIEASVTEPKITDVFVSEDAVVSADPVEEAPSVEAVLDETVTEADLGLSEPVKAPGAFHFLKRFGRAVQEATTFDATEKNELRLKNANIDFLEGKKAAEEKGDFSFAEKAAERAEKRLGKITESIKNQKGAGDERSNQLLDSVLDNHIKHQKILGAVEAQALVSAPEFATRLHNVQEKTSEHVGEALTAGEQSADQVTERINRVFSEQQGSEFRDLRNLEVLQQIEDHVPEEARVGIERAQDATLNRFRIQIEQLPEENRGEKFNQYVRNFGGDKTRHLQMFEQMKQFEGLPQEIQEQIEAAKDIAANRFQQELQGGSQEFRNQAFARFRIDVDPNKLRVMSEIRQRVHVGDAAIEAEIKEHESKSIDAFVSQFPDAESDAAQFKKLSEEMASNPSPNTFRILQELETKVKADPKKAAFIAQMEQQTKQQFAKRAQEHGDRFLQEIAGTTNPEDIAIFQQLQSEFSSDPDQFFGPPPFGDFGPEGFGPPGDFGSPGDFGPEGGFPPFGEPGFGPESAGSFGPQGFGPPPGFASFFDRAIQKNAEALTKNIQQVNDPALFEQFQKKIQSVSPEVLETIQQKQSNFQSIFQQKRDFVAEFQLQQKGQGQFPFGAPPFGPPPQGFDPSNPSANQPFPSKTPVFDNFPDDFPEDFPKDLPSFEDEHGPFPPPSGDFNPAKDGFIPGPFPPPFGQDQKLNDNNSGSGSQGKNQQNPFFNQKSFLNTQKENKQNQPSSEKQNQPQLFFNQNKVQIPFGGQNTEDSGLQEPKPFFPNQPFGENKKLLVPESKGLTQPQPFGNEQPILNQPKPFFNEPIIFEKNQPTEPQPTQPNQPVFEQPKQPVFEPLSQPTNQEPQLFQPQNNPIPFSPPPTDDHSGSSGSGGSGSGSFSGPSGDSGSFSGPSAPSSFPSAPPSGEVHGIFGSFLRDVGQGFTIVRSLFTRSVTAGTGFFIGR